MLTSEIPKLPANLSLSLCFKSLKRAEGDCGGVKCPCCISAGMWFARDEVQQLVQNLHLGGNGQQVSRRRHGKMDCVKGKAVRKGMLRGKFPRGERDVSWCLS